MKNLIEAFDKAKAEKKGNKRNFWQWLCDSVMDRDLPAAAFLEREQHNAAETFKLDLDVEGFDQNMKNAKRNYELLLKEKKDLNKDLKKINVVMQQRIDNCKDEDKRKEYQSQLDTITSCYYDKDGKRYEPERIEKNIERSMVAGFGGDKEEYQKWMDGVKSDINKAKTDKAKGKISKISDKEAEENFKKHNSSKEESKEEVVKDASGVEWIKRKKERGDGYTYCKKDDNTVTMSQKQYQKHKASQKKNECLISLKNYLNESLEY